MNWGKGIIGGMVLFMLFIIGMSIKMFSVPADDFDKQYYEKGLNFNNDQTREERVIKSHAKPAVAIGNGQIRLTFARPVKGTAKLFRPDNKLLDTVFHINSGAGNVVTIPLHNVKVGQWQLLLDWQSNQQYYLYNQEIYIK